MMTTKGEQHCVDTSPVLSKKLRMNISKGIRLCCDRAGQYQLIDAGSAKVTVAESFVLLWQDNMGRMPGRKQNAKLKAIAAAACLADLVLMGYLELNSVFCPEEEREVMLVGLTDLHMNNDLPMEAMWLDPLLQEIVEFHITHEEPRSLESWVQLMAVTSILNGGSNKRGSLSKRHIDRITNSLCGKGVIGKEPAWNGSRFPVLDAAVKDAVREHLRTPVLSVTPEQGRPPATAVALLFFAKLANEEGGLVNGPFLGSRRPSLSDRTGSVFTKEEFDYVSHNHSFLIQRCFK